MGQFLDEAPSEAPRGKFLDEEPQPNAITRGYQAVAKPVTNLLSKGLQIAGDTGLSPYSLEAPADLIAKTVVPQTPLAAGAQAGTMLGGPLAPLLRASPWLGRILGGALGGEAGGQMSGEPTGKGAAIGGGSAAFGEGVGALGGKVARSLPGAKSRIAADDAARYGEQMGLQSPPLAGATTAGELRTMAAGPGRQALGQAKEGAVANIESMLPGGAATPLTIPALGGPRSLRDANMALSQIGARAFSRNPLERTVQGIDQRRLYGQVANEIEAALPATARPLWQQAQADYRRGISLLKPLQQSQSYRQYPDELQLNTPALQSWVANPKNEAALRNKLGDQGFEALVNALTRGGGVGTRDILASGQGRMLDAVRQSFGRGTNTGSLQLLGVPFRTALPNAGSQYTGQAPYTLPPALQTILDVALQRASP